MNTILLILLCIFEAAFAFTAIRRRADKKGWQTGRLICSGGQLALFLIMLIAPGIDMSFRFTGLFILLVLRIIIAFIGMMIIRNKEEKSKHPAMMILSALLSVLLISGSLIPSFVISDYSGLPVSGEYEIAEGNAILIDQSRTEEFEADGSKREVPVYFYYPANAGENEKFPLVIFSHGAFGYNQSNFSTFTELASNGYVVISTEHPYHSLFTKDTGGNTITVDPEFLNSIALINTEGTSEETIFELSSRWVKLRCDDIDLVINSVKSAAGESALPEYWYTEEGQNENILAALSVTDTEKIGVMGHSLGGAAAVSLGRTRDDISAVIDLDGTMIGEVLGVENERDIINEEPYTTPLLSFDNEEHHFSAEQARAEDIPYANNTVHDNTVCGYRTYIPGTGHMNYTDLPMYSPPLAAMLGTGTVDASECMMTVNSITLGFFDRYLKGEGEFIVQECTDIS
ncbi:MAG: alpha/beta hydrolase family protein [Huintestinicola sp.]|uniref:alpha/beta hydrolase family protein n=1 Tax=Huintestinicola sp. TaxID=2981661 RepID=UPI003F01DBBA